MSDTTLESRVNHLEQQVSVLMKRTLTPPLEKDWRATLGMFDGDSLMLEIDAEGKKLREADREQFHQ